MTKKAIIYSDNFGQLTSLRVERMVKKLPPSLTAFGRITFVTASPGSYNHLLSLGSSFPLQLKEIKAVSPTQFAGEQPVFLPHSISRKNLLTRGLRPSLTFDPKEAQGSEVRHSSSERLLTSGSESRSHLDPPPESVIRQILVILLSALSKDCHQNNWTDTGIPSKN